MLTTIRLLTLYKIASRTPRTTRVDVPTEEHHDVPDVPVAPAGAVVRGTDGTKRRQRGRARGRNVRQYADATPTVSRVRTAEATTQTDFEPSFTHERAPELDRTEALNVRTEMCVDTIRAEYLISTYEG